MPATLEVATGPRLSPLSLAAKEDAPGQPAQVTVHMPVWDREIATSLGASEIRTLLVPDDPSQPIREVDLIERA